MLIRWIARPDACDECKHIAAGSPYERLPTWPGLGDTGCDCRCSVEGTRAGNVMAMAGEPMASPSERGISAPTPERTISVPPVEALDPAPASRRAVSAPAPDRAAAAHPSVNLPPPSAQSSVAEPEPATVARDPGRTPSLASLTTFRVKPLERRWAFALGALIFVAAFVALFSTH